MRQQAGRPAGRPPSSPRRRPRARPAVMASAIVFSTLAWGIVAVALWPIYRTAPFVVVAAVGILVGTAIAVGAALARWAAWGVLLAAVAVFTIIGVPLAVPARTVYGVLPEPAGLLELFAGVVLGWRQLLTIDLPVGSYQALLVPALVILFAGPLLTMSVALRTRRRALAAVAPALGFPLAIALGREDAPLPLAAAIGFAAVLMLWMVVLRRHRRAEALRSGGAAAALDGRGAVIRSFAAAAVLLLVAGVAGAAAASVVQSPAERVVLRSLVERPFDPRELPSPLAAYRSAFEPARADREVLRVEGMPEGARLRIATLDSYDGVVFAVGSEAVSAASGRFVRIPTERDVRGVDGEAATLRVELLDATGSWLPTAGELRAVRFEGGDAAGLRDRFRYNATTGTAAFIGGTEQGLAYTLETVIPAERSVRLEDAVPGASAVPGIVEVPDELRAWIDGVTAGVEGAGPQLAAALDALARDGYVSHGVGDDEPSSRSGHSLARLAELVSKRPMVGDAEQYAAAAALIAREFGFPSRVVLGYGPTAAGTVTLRSDELTAWIEVDTAADGWTTVDVVPAEREVPPAEPVDPVPVSRPQIAVQPPIEDPPAPEEQAPPEIEPVDRLAEDPFLALLSAIARITGIAILAVALIAAPFLGVIATKASRRRRRRAAGDPMRRILGGWRELADAAVDHGVALPVGGTRREAALAIGRPQAGVLARVADRVDYAPETPDSGEADRVWIAVDAVRASLGEGMRRRDRWRAAFSTRSLRGYPGRSRPEQGRRTR